MIVEKIIVQSKPAATTSTDIYTVGAGATLTISFIFICNQGGASDTIRISIAVAGAVLADTQYIYYDKSVGANDTLIVGSGLILNPTDVIRIYSTTGNTSFTLSGITTIL
jgi:hypothetical protein